MDDLRGVTMVHLTTATTAQITRRKPDNTGWWIAGGGGLADFVIESGEWVPLGVVVAAYRKIVAEGLLAGATDVAPQETAPPSATPTERVS